MTEKKSAKPNLEESVLTYDKNSKTDFNAEPLYAAMKARVDYGMSMLKAGVAYGKLAMSEKNQELKGLYSGLARKFANQFYDVLGFGRNMIRYGMQDQMGMQPAMASPSYASQRQEPSYRN
jgi:hypothetical protein